MLEDEYDDDVDFDGEEFDDSDFDDDDLDDDDEAFDDTFSGEFLDDGGGSSYKNNETYL